MKNYSDSCSGDLPPPPPLEEDLPAPPPPDMAPPPPDMAPPPPEMAPLPHELAPPPPDMAPPPHELAPPPPDMDVVDLPPPPSSLVEEEVPVTPVTPAKPARRKTPPTHQSDKMAYKPVVRDMPKSALTQFGCDVTEIAHSKETAGSLNTSDTRPKTGKFFKLLQSHLDYEKAEKASKDTEVPANPAPASLDLISMAYTPTKSTTSPTRPRTLASSKPSPPSSLTSNSQDMKKKFDTMNLNDNRFQNKGSSSFYNKYGESPETPTNPITPTNVPKVGDSPPLSTFTTPPPTPPSSTTPPLSGAAVKKEGVPLRRTPVRPPVRPITPPPEQEPCVRSSCGGVVSSSKVSTCASPLPRHNSNTPQFNVAPRKISCGEPPIRPSMVSLVDEPIKRSSPPSLSKFMYGGGTPSFNSPDKSYDRSTSAPSPSTTTPAKPTSPSTAAPSKPRSNSKPLLGPKHILLPICRTCRQEIRGPYAGSQGRAWHAEHFVCSKCSGDLSQGFKEVEDSLFCGECYFENFGEKCANCNKPCVGAVVQALGKNYHPEHFTCFTCSTVLTDGFNVDNGNPYCKKCHTNFMPLCAGCNSRIEGASQWISALSKDWHNGCFTCSVCKAPLAGSSFFHDGTGNALCQVHARSAPRTRVN